MKKFFLAITVVTFIICIFSAGTFVLAQGGGGTSGGSSGTGTSGGGSPVVLPNPLGDNSDFFSLLDRFINVLTIFAAPILVALIVIAGFYYMLSGSDPSKRATATNIIKYGIIGFIVIIFARGIAAIVQGVL